MSQGQLDMLRGPSYPRRPSMSAKSRKVPEKSAETAPSRCDQQAVRLSSAGQTQRQIEFAQRSRAPESKQVLGTRYQLRLRTRCIKSAPNVPLMNQESPIYEDGRSIGYSTY